MISVGVSRWRAISDGWTKIDAPMIVPATIAVALTRVRERGRSANLQARPIQCSSPSVSQGT
jgi:hypothetical protein